MLETSPCEVLWGQWMEGVIVALWVLIRIRRLCAKKPLPKVCRKDDRDSCTADMQQGSESSFIAAMAVTHAWEAPHLSQYPEGFSLFTSHNAARDCKLYLWPHH